MSKDGFSIIAEKDGRKSYVPADGQVGAAMWFDTRQKADTALEKLNGLKSSQPSAFDGLTFKVVPVRHAG